MSKNPENKIKGIDKVSILTYHSTNNKSHSTTKQEIIVESKSFKCFGYGQIGHVRKDCPQNNDASVEEINENSIIDHDDNNYPTTYTEFTKKNS